MPTISELKAEAADIYRDSVAPGSALPNDPDKARIRSHVSRVLDRMAETEEAASAGRRIYGTIAQRDAWSDRPVGAQAYVEATGLYYRWDGAWVAFDDPTIAAADRATEAALVLEGVAEPASAAAIKVGDLWSVSQRRPLADTDAVASTGTDLWGTGHFIWGVAKAMVETGPLKALRTRIQDLSGAATTIRAEVYRLPSDLTAFPIPVDLSAYELVSTTNTPALNLLGSRRIAADQIGVDIPLGGQVEPAGRQLLILVSALNGGGDRVQLNLARGVAGGGESAWLRGLYSDTASGAPLYQTAPGGYRAWGQLLTDTAAMIPSAVLGVAAGVAERARPGLGVRWQAPAAWRAADGFRELSFAAHVARPVRTRAIAPLLFDLNLADTIRYRIYRRPAGLDLAAAPGTDSRDELLVTGGVSVAAAAPDPTSAAAQSLALPFEHVMDPAWVYLVNLSASNAGAVVGLGLATGDNAATANGADTKLFWYALGDDQRTLGAIAGQRAAWSVIEAAASPDFGLLPTTPTVRALEIPLRRAGRTLALPGCELARMGGALVIPPQTVTISDIAADTLTETRTVEAFNGKTVWASRKYLSSLTVTGDGGVALTDGSDYSANMKTGLVQLFGGTAPYDVSLTVTGFRTRYDLVWADPITGEIGVAEGVARGRDPEEYLAALPSGKVALWHVHVTPGVMELLPVHRFRNMVEIGREAEFQAIREHNLRCLPGLAKRMRTGAAFPLLGYGDSQTEIADGAEPEQQLVANTGRDGLRYLQGAIPADTIAANVARFNEDGTPNASGPIIHIGWSYALEAAIEARSACAVSYFNLGIGGTTAADTLVNGLYNGGHPDRLAAAIATGAKLAVIAFGMNQLGDPAIFSQTVAIVAAFRAAEIECIILTVPGTNVFGPSGDQAAIDKWQATNDHLVRAALATDTAYVPFHMITGVGQEAALGISRESFSAANAVNHDGPYVMKKLGAFLAMMVTP